MTDDKKAVKEFNESVNMSAGQIDKWLNRDESKEVGYKDGGEGESVGHRSGRKIIEILGKKANDYTSADLKHIHKVVGYIHRHLAQRPEGDVKDSNWRYSLMNWGHDPI